MSAGTRETAAFRGAGSRPPVFGFSTTAVQMTAFNQCVVEVGRLEGRGDIAVNGLGVSGPGRIASSSWEVAGVGKRRVAAPGGLGGSVHESRIFSMRTGVAAVATLRPAYTEQREVGGNPDVRAVIFRLL